MLAAEGGFGNKAAELYARLDKDGDGQLTAEEMKQVCKLSHRAAHAHSYFYYPRWKRTSPVR